MGRNIILCSDGTGNKGGTGADTNVFKIYKAIKLGGAENLREQITFYDDGLGTSGSSIARILGGMTGSGFKRNVRDLFEFAGRHYRDGDDIYGFGFSRGAATIRAFAGMVDHCGLVLKTTPERELEEPEFQEKIDAAMRDYARRGPPLAIGRLWDSFFSRKYEGARVEIELLGLWDTVAALGFPQIKGFDALVNFFRRHRFYDFEPSNVKHVLHAVAIDDERRTFWPLIWGEKNEAADQRTEEPTEQHIKQVWFSGVHSSVGGGRPRAGLANVALDWMIAGVDKHRSCGATDRGLVLNASFHDDVRDGVNPFGRLVDSRAGFSTWYRYQPRRIAEQCEGKLKGSIEIHSSVLERMTLKTEGYSPGYLPPRFDLVGNPTESQTTETRSDWREETKPIDLKQGTGKWKPIRDKITVITRRRIILYWFFLISTLVLAIVSIYFWVGDFVLGGLTPTFGPDSAIHGLLGHLADVLRYVLPTLFDNIIDFGVHEQPEWGGGFLLVVGVYYGVRVRLQKRYDAACEVARKFVVERAATPASTESGR